MKILVPTTTFPRYKGDYLANFFLTLFKEIKKYNLEIKVIAPHYYTGRIIDNLEGIDIERFRYFIPSKFENLAYDEGITINLAKKPYLFLQLPLFAINYALKIIKNYNKCDLIHAQFGPSGLLSVMVKKLFHKKKPIITSFYGSDIAQCLKFKKIYKILFDKGDLFFVLGEEMKNQLIEAGCDKNKILILPLGIYTDEFITPRDYSNKKEINFLFVGRIIEKKGLIWAIRAFNECYKVRKNIKLNIVGDGIELAKIKKEVRRLNLKEVIKFYGSLSREKTKILYKKSDIFILPSLTASGGDKEGQPMAIMEAQASGLPCISTKHADIPKIVGDKKTGFLSKEKDYKDMAANMLKLIDNKKLLKNMSKNAVKFAKKHFDLKELAKKFVEAYYATLKN